MNLLVLIVHSILLIHMFGERFIVRHCSFTIQEQTIVMLYELWLVGDGAGPLTSFMACRRIIPYALHCISGAASVGDASNTLAPTLLLNRACLLHLRPLHIIRLDEFCRWIGLYFKVLGDDLVWAKVFGACIATSPPIWLSVNLSLDWDVAIVLKISVSQLGCLARIDLLSYLVTLLHQVVITWLVLRTASNVAIWDGFYCCFLAMIGHISIWIQYSKHLLLFNSQIVTELFNNLLKLIDFAHLILCQAVPRSTFHLLATIVYTGWLLHVGLGCGSKAWLKLATLISVDSQGRPRLYVSDHLLNRMLGQFDVYGWQVDMNAFICADDGPEPAIFDALHGLDHA